VVDLLEIFKTPIELRPDHWEDVVLKALPSRLYHLLDQTAAQGPDGWPYLRVGFVESSGVSASGSTQTGESATQLFEWLSARGIGLWVDPLNSNTADTSYLITYGMVLNFCLNGELKLKDSSAPLAEEFTLDGGAPIHCGPPSHEYLPKTAQKILRAFLQDQGVLMPKILMISENKKDYDLCFSLESLGSPPKTEHQGILEAISWFLPTHYRLALISEQGLPRFFTLGDDAN